MTERSKVDPAEAKRRLDDYVRQIVDRAPPLDQSQKDRLRQLLAPSPRT